MSFEVNKNKKICSSISKKPLFKNKVSCVMYGLRLVSTSNKKEYEEA